MNFSFKRRPLKKTLSAVLAVIIVLCSVTSVLGVFAEDKSAAQHYTISSASPALPMYADTMVDLSNLFVEVGGESVSGSALSWAVDASVANGEVKIVDKTLYVLKTGRYLITATDGSNTQNIWVIANEKGNTDFNLVDIDFSKDGAYVAADWIYAASGASGAHTAYTVKDISTSEEIVAPHADYNYLNVTGTYKAEGNQLILYKAPILKDFAAYTVNAKVSSHNPHNGSTFRTGILFNAEINLEAEAGSSLFGSGVNGSYLVQTDARTLVNLGSLDKGTIYDGLNVTNGTRTENGFENRTAHTLSSLPESYSGLTAGTHYLAKNTVGEMNVVLTGEDIIYSVNSTPILDTTKNTVTTTLWNLTNASNLDWDTQVKSGIKLTSGNTIGIVSSDNETHLYSLKVSFGEATVPSFAQDIYVISSASPALPMYTDTMVDLSKLFVEVGGESVSGSALSWAVDTSVVNEEVKIVNNMLYVFEAGRYKLTATDTASNTTQNIWVIANEKDNTDFSLVDIDFSKDGAYVAADWIYAASGANGANTSFTVMEKDSAVFTAPTQSNPYVVIKGSYSSRGNQLLLYKAPILEDFDGYTVNAKVTNVAPSSYASTTFRTGILFNAEINLNAAVGSSLFSGGVNGSYLVEAAARTVVNLGSLNSTTIYTNNTRTENGFENRPIHTLSPKPTATSDLTAGTHYLAKNTAGEMNVVLTGEDIVYSISNLTTNTTTTILDTTKNTVTTTLWNLTDGYDLDWDTQVKSKIKLTAGNTIGIVNSNNETHLYTLKVSIGEVTVPSFAQDIYVISSASPALPMYADTTVDLSKLFVEVGGESVSGSALSWAVDASVANGEVKIVDKTLYVLKTGRYLITATDGSNTQNIWVIANEKGNTDFSLVDIDFSKDGAYVAADWIYAASGASGAHTAYTVKDISTSEEIVAPHADYNYLNVTGTYKAEGNQLILYKAPILKDFAAYTVNAKVSSHNPHNGSTFRTGILFNAEINLDAAVGSSLFGSGVNGSYLVQTDARTLVNLGSLDKGTIYDGLNVTNGTRTENGFENRTAHTLSSLPESYTGLTAGTHYLAKNTVGEMNVVLTGEDIIYSVNSTPILDTTKNTITTTLWNLTNASNLDWDTQVKSGIKLTSGNTIGIVSSDNETHLYSLKVSFGEATVPSFAEDYRCLEIPANTRYYLEGAAFNLDGTETSVSGDTLVWTTDSALCEISGGYLNVYAAGTATVIGTSNAGTVTLNLTFTPAGTETMLYVEAFADENIAIIKEGNKYTFTVADTANLIPGSLAVTDNGSPVYSVEIEGESGKAFSANVYAPHTMQVSAQYAADENELLTNTYMIGNQIRTDDGNGIRFVSAIPAVRNDASGQEVKLIGDKVVINGKPVTLDAVGTLLIPAVGIGSGSLTPDTFDITQENIEIGGQTTARNVVIKYLANATDEFSIANTTLNKIPDSYKALDISCVTYLHYEDDEGNQGFIYSNILTASYNEIQDKVYPELDNKNIANNVGLILTGGTDHDLDGVSTTDSISYKKGEDITFSIKLKGMYKINWALYKDNAAENLYGVEQVASGSSTRLVNESVNYSYVDNYFTCTTQRSTAGAVMLKVSVLGPNNQEVTSFSLTALVDAENITQPLEDLVEAQTLMAETNAAYTAWTAEWDANVTAVTAAAAADVEFTAWLANESKAAGDEKTVSDGTTDVIKLKVASVTDNYISYHYWIATNAATGIDTTATADNFNSRPATGAIIVPKNFSGTTNITMSFKGYEDGKGATGIDSWNQTSYANNKYIKINTNNNGLNNNDSSTEVIEKNSYMGNQTVENADKLYQYGIIRRNYTVLQVTKALFADMFNNTVNVGGGSMGAWQSVTMAMLDEQITAVNISIPWMANLGATDAGKINSWHPPYDNDGKNGARIFSTTTAARIINARISESGEAYTFKIGNAGLGDYSASAPASVMALYNAMTAPNCSKSIAFYQFVGHGNNFYDNSSVSGLDSGYCSVRKSSGN